MALTDVDTRALLASLSPDDRTALLDELPAAVTKRLMQLLSLISCGVAATLATQMTAIVAMNRTIFSVEWTVDKHWLTFASLLVIVKFSIFST